MKPKSKVDAEVERAVDKINDSLGLGSAAPFTRQIITMAVRAGVIIGVEACNAIDQDAADRAGALDRPAGTPEALKKSLFGPQADGATSSR